jgi:hypothetical protein
MNPMDMMKNFQKFKADMEAKNPGMNPQDMINKMMASGQVSQAQFEQARNFASMLGIKM